MLAETEALRAGVSLVAGSFAFSHLPSLVFRSDIISCFDFFIFGLPVVFCCYNTIKKLISMAGLKKTKTKKHEK